MKNSRSDLLSSTAIVHVFTLLIGVGLSVPAMADDLLWDINDAEIGPQGGTGIWNEGSNENWWDPDLADLENTQFQNGDDVTFGAVPVAVPPDPVTPPPVVTITEDVRPGSITFAVDGYTINADQPSDDLRINPGATIDVTTGTATINANVRNEGEMFINSAATSLGTLVLGGANQDSESATFNLQRGGLTISGSTDAGDQIVNNGGLVTVEGTIGGTLANNVGSLSLEGGTVNGLTTIADGTAFGRGGNFAGGVEMGGGTLTIENDTAGNVTNGAIIPPAVVATGGTLTINQFESDLTTPVTLSGNVTNDLGTTNNNGTIAGNVFANGGTVNNNATGRIDEEVTVAGGAVVNAGDVGGAVVITAAGGTFENTGDLESTLAVNGGSFDNETGGAVTGLATVNGGALNANGGGFTAGIDVVSGNLTVNAATSADVTNHGGTVTIAGANVLTSGLFQHQGGSTVINGTLIGPVEVEGGSAAESMDNLGAITGAVTVTDGVLNNGDGTVLNAGAITGTVGVSGTGVVNNNLGSSISDAVTVDGSGELNANGGTFGNGIILSGGTLNVTASTTASVTNGGGDVVVGGAALSPAATLTTVFSQSGGTTTIAATGTLDDTSGNISLNGGTLTNSGAILDQVTVDGSGTLNAAGGTFGMGIIANAGTINFTGNTLADLTNQGSAVTVANGITVTGTTVNESGTIVSDGSLTGTLNVTGGSVTQTANGNVTGATTVGSAGPGTAQLIAQGGSFGGVTATANGEVTIGGAVGTDVVNNGGTVMINGAGDLTGDMTNNDGSLTVADGGHSSGSLTITGATADSVVTTQGTIDGSVTQSGGTFTTIGNSNVGLATTVSGGVLQANGGTFGSAIATPGIVGSGGQININGAVTSDVSVTGADFNVTGTGKLTGDVTMDVGAVIAGTNLGTIDGDVTANVGGFNSSGNITGDVVAGGTEFVSSGTIGGSVFANAGTFQNSGTINGNGPSPANDFGVDVNGGIFYNNTGGVIDDPVRVQNGTFFANGGVVNGDVTVQGATSNFTVTATSSADVINGGAGGVPVGGVVTVNAGQTLNGDVTNNAGTTTINGGLTGALVVTGGSATTTGTSTGVTGPVTVTDGLLTAQAGTFGSDISAAGGQTDVTGAITMAGNSALTGDGGDVNILAAGIVNGAVVANEVALGATDMVTNEGRINGTVTVGGAVNAGETTFDNQGAVRDLVTVNGGIASNTGALEAGLRVNGGQATNAGMVAQGVTVDAGQFTITGGAITGASVVNGGTFDAAGGQFLDGVRNEGGDIVVSGNAQGDINNVDGTTVVNALVTLNGGIDNAATGTLTITGAVTGNVGNVDGAVGLTGTVGSLSNTGGTVTGNGAVSGDVVNVGGTLDVNTVGGNLGNTGGMVTANGAVSGDVVNVDGTLDINTVGGNLSNTGGTVIANGPVGGNVVNLNGSLDINGIVGGDLDNTGGTVNANSTVTGATTNTGATAEIVVATAATFTNGITNQGGGTLTVGGALIGNVSNLADSVLDANNATLQNDLLNAGTANFTGTNISNGLVTNNATLNIGAFDTSIPQVETATGNLTVNGTLTNQSGGVLTITDGSSIGAMTFDNAAGGDIFLHGQISSAISNSGNIYYDNAGSPFAEQVTNNAGGLVELRAGALNFGAGLVNNGVVDASSGRLVNDPENAANMIPVVNDVVTINGGLSGNGTFVLDLDLSADGGDVAADGTGASDYVNVTGGPVTGNMLLSFNILDTGGQQDENILVFQAAANPANNFTLRVEGLPDPGEAILYVPDDTQANSLYIVDALNPGIGALAGSIVLTQSLIGSVINRPSSPFVSGLAYDDPDPCGVGLWTRAINGEADSSGDITEINSSNLSFTGEISADFYGMQAGGDVACFNGYFDGWDISLGGIGGFNQGTTQQPIFGLEGNGAGGLILGELVTSVTTVDFDQTYAGGYVTGAYNRFAVDLQYRFEQTDFVADNVGRNSSAGLGLEDSQFSSEAATFSGSISYAIPFGESNLAFVPTAGFAYSDVKTDEIGFANGSSVQVQDFNSETVFVGGTLSRTSFGADGTSAINQFGTVTYYNDFADSPTSIFTPVAAGETPRAVETENLGAYTELSAGLNYIRILQPGAPGGAKQLSASLRGDLRSSDQLDSWGVTGQFRVQF